jgi:uncharacterized protein
LTLIVQGKRDGLGARELVSKLTLAPAIQFEWIGDGNHDFKPTAKSNFTHQGNMQTAMEAVAAFVAGPAAAPGDQ